MCSDGCDPYESAQPYLFGSALDDAEREDEAREKRGERDLCCGVCNGSGEGYADCTKCRKCGGSGALEKWPRKQEAEERKPTSNDYREAVQARKPEAAKVTANHKESFDEATDLLRDLINTEERYQVLADWSEKLSALLTICEFKKKEAGQP